MNNVPRGIKIIGILYYAGAALAAIWLVLMIFSGQSFIVYSISRYANMVLMAIAGVLLLFSEIFNFMMIKFLASQPDLNSGAFIGLMLRILWPWAVTIGYAVLAFFVGRGLLKSQKWARNTAIVLACIGIIMAVVYIIRILANAQFLGILIALPVLALNLVIAIYLIFVKWQDLPFRQNKNDN